MASSFFEKLIEGPPIEVFYMNKLFCDDPASTKVNLTIGAYRTEEGKPWLLPVVQEAEQEIVKQTYHHEYLPVLGFEPFTRVATELVLGKESIALKEGRAFGVQCLSGTGSLRAGAELLSRLMGINTVYLSEPTWGNHKLVFKNAGFTTIKGYRYWSNDRSIDFAGLIEDLKNAPQKSAVVLHGCAHNPTGMDPSHEQWKKIAEIVKDRNLFTFFDIAYQGFASGDPDSDAWAIRYFVSFGLEMFVAQSFAKNFGLYNERVGNLTIVTADVNKLPDIRSQISLIIRAMWSNPPAHGCRIVQMVLEKDDLRQKWLEAIKIMSSRIREMRIKLRQCLEDLKTPGTWEHITEQIGMFSYTGLDKSQVDNLIQKHKVYLLSDGRINVCGLNNGNVEYVARAINETVKMTAAA